ncbi:MAG: hypothetical protein PHC66_04680 [Candidatus Nanoarchaeia archaeon]|nr:hypothetical protein [Candidatus Nanoarchaeia archaeon]MDD5239479.1 hypothetical protein [Candidatus Nanoarchaeia archaeon]
MSEKKSYVAFHVKTGIEEKQMADLASASKKYALNKIYFLASTKSGYETIDPKKAAALIKEGKSAELSFVMKFKGPKFTPELSVSFEPDKKGCLLCVSTIEDNLTRYFDNSSIEKDSGVLNQKMFLDFCKDVYNIFHPLIGFSGRNDFEGDSTKDWLSKLEIRYLSSIMFFGHDYVKKYGKVQLLKTYGAWKIDAFKDGGVMIALQPMMSAWGIGSKEKEFVKASSHLLALFKIKHDKENKWLFY